MTSDRGHWRVRGPTRPARLATAERGADAAPTILVVGAVHDVESLWGVGRVQRARWAGVAPRAARSPADLVVVGRPLTRVDAGAVIAGLKTDPATAAIPVLHAAPAEAACTGCRADVCLSAGSAPGQVARVSHALLELARAQARSSGLDPARASLAAGVASRPAP